ncbi:hypothetical protein Vadar_005324 [Vaccinium darrowii]|uniref:Uncharacterized protein n=1 Tax=Vaccinium darrowii TaxID=229202 RepID=A0ACB7XNF3_9ERIC|nr:hypothetical protein Vadar_005324 [Vaccinium darrowii]
MSPGPITYSPEGVSQATLVHHYMKIVPSLVELAKVEVGGVGMDAEGGERSSRLERKWLQRDGDEGQPPFTKLYASRNTNNHQNQPRICKASTEQSSVNDKLRCLEGILSKDGVVLVGEKKVTSKLLQTSTSTEKMYKIDDHVACAVAGIMSDANILINTTRVQAQRYTFSYQEPMPVEQLVQSLCDTKQGYTQFGGLRPFGVSFLFAGWDKNYGFQLYMSDPSGNYGGWKAAAIGANNQAAQSMLKQDYKDEITREEAVQLALKVLSKTMDSTSLTSDKLELAEVFVSSGKVKYQVSSADSLSKLLAKFGLTQPAADAS